MYSRRLMVQPSWIGHKDDPKNIMVEIITIRQIYLV